MAVEMKDKEAVFAVGGLTVHAWNAAEDKVALSKNDSEVLIYDTAGEPRDCTKWKLEHTLEGHSGSVSGIDWSAVNGFIVTCGHDRNAYVWKQDEKGEWTPTLVILRINRAATSVRWSPAGNKFAVTSGAKCVPVCHFEESNNWWISKMVKKHKSTVLCLDWCPNNKFIVTGATDFKARVVSTFIPALDAEDDDGFGAVWKKQNEFGEVLAEFDQAKAWINAVAWSPNGFRIAFAGHGSTVHFARVVAGAKKLPTQTIECQGLPFLALDFLNDDVVLGGGFSCTPTTFVATGADDDTVWKQCEELDKGVEKKEDPSKKKSAFGNARALFGAAADEGQSFGKKTKKTTVLTKHKNAIQSVRLLGKAEGKLTTQFSTCGIDGRILFWDLATMDCDKASYGL